MMNKQNKRKKKDITQTSLKMRKVLAQATNMDSDYDPNGSYTGCPVSVNEKPVQDADDL